MSVIKGINFPLEVGTRDANCTICHEKLNWAVFCPRCQHGNCFQCLKKWHNVKRECPTCRYTVQLAGTEEVRQRYGCAQDGNLVEYYCEQCLVCFCGKCYSNPSNVHYKHAVRMVDVLRKDIMQLINSNVFADNSLVLIKSIMGTGSPHEIVRQRRVLLSILDHSNIVLPSKMFEKSIKLVNVNVEKQVFSATDYNGNVWELTVYPNGFSDGKGKFISLYLRLIKGIPTRYEYCFKIFDKNGYQPMETYSAVDDFDIGSESLACQRLIHINEAYGKCLSTAGYNMAFSVKPTNPNYKEECAAALLRNKQVRLAYNTFSWTLKNFEVKKLANKIEFSPVVFDQQKISWRLRVDCNGHWEQGMYVSVFLELLDGAKGWFDIFIKLCNPLAPAQQHMRELTHEFTVHSNWGVPHYVRHTELYRYLHNDELRFEFGIRPAHVDQEQ
ncbi:uncharacterized protein LOC134220926 [Armigeres subalbatus]|uniref:uncharacterized protein LOC134220926 n=1 Tax=Armigeres subalbatus TaxID=124917 RepID=UPI002ED158D6